MVPKVHKCGSFWPPHTCYLIQCMHIPKIGVVRPSESKMHKFYIPGITETIISISVKILHNVCNMALCSLVWCHKKSKMADGCHFVNCFIAISWWKIIWFWWNLVDGSRFLPCDAAYSADYAVLRFPSVRVSIHLSQWYSVETAKHIIKHYIPSGSHTILHCVQK